MAQVHDDCLIHPSDVREIVDSELTDARVANFCNLAYLMTLPAAGKLGQCGGATMLKHLQLLLAAHFLKLYEPTVGSESIVEWTVTYQLGPLGKGLESTPYGQQAKTLDCSGTLASAGLKAARFGVVSYYQTKDSTVLFDGDLL